METKKQNKILERLKKSVFVGIAASVGLTLIMLIFFSNKNFQRVGIVMLGATVVLFFLKLLFDSAIDIIMEKIGSDKRMVAEGLFILFALLAFSSTAISAIAPALLFQTVHDKKAQRALEQYGEDVVEPLCIETNYGTMTGWFLHNAPDHSPAILYFGGNYEDASYRILRLLENNQERAVFDGWNIVCLDYPGYGTSEGVTSEKNIKQYGVLAYDYLTGRKDVSGVMLVGYSLGTGVANYVASQRQPLGLVLMAPYASGYDLYNHYFNIFHGPFRSLVAFKMKAVNDAKDVAVKPLLIASKADEVVPYESAKKLFEKYEKGCNFVTIDEIEHNAFWETPEVLAEIDKYISQVW